MLVANISPPEASVAARMVRRDRELVELKCRHLGKIDAVVVKRDELAVEADRRPSCRQAEHDSRGFRDEIGDASRDCFGNRVIVGEHRDARASLRSNRATPEAVSGHQSSL
jgi:hypothetical protein